MGRWVVVVVCVCVGGELSLVFPLLSLRRKGQVFTCERLSR